MDIQILTKERMSESGSSLLKLMQSQSIKTLDLLVRESIQNSLDASKDRKSKTRVNVDFITGGFNTDSFCNHFPYISERLKKRYPKTTHDFIAVRDSGTTGLTGTTDVEDDRSRLQGLIYQISKNQQEKGSGGNWGLGKTTFFRIGIGLVVYYSRTRENNQYLSKMAAALVEDETKQPLITEPNSRGIAFFGDYLDSSKKDIRSLTVPVTNEDEINKLLSLFSIKPYSGDETGTTIIMPFADLDKHLKEMLPEKTDQSNRNPSWTNNIDNCLRILIQRWYAPRISNPEYPGSWLKPSVNGKTINYSDMEPIFALIRDLYNLSVNQNYTSELLDDIGYDSVRTSPIKCKAIVGQIGGNIASAYVKTDSLHLTSEINRNAYSYIGDYTTQSGAPIVTYTRKPGMLIRYETKNSAWVPQLQDLEEDKILICVFRLDSEKYLSAEKTDLDLEEYVRSCEKSDHYEWVDKPKFSIISKLSTNTASKLQELYGNRKEETAETRSGLCDVFSEAFLPAIIPHNDKKPASVTRPRGYKKQSAKNKSVLSSNTLDHGTRVVRIETKNAPRNNISEYEITVVTENGSIGADEWEKLFDKPFPLVSESVAIVGYGIPRGNIIECNDKIKFDKKTNNFERYYTETTFTKAFGKPYKIKIISDRPGVTIICEFRLSCLSDYLTFDIRSISGGR